MAMSDTDTEDDYCYEMNNVRRGYFLINSVECFSRPEVFNQRHGNEADIERLERTFGRLGFITMRVTPDPTSAQMLEAVNKLASLDHTNFDCVGMAIMSHGDVDENRDDIIFGNDGTSVKLKDLLVPLKKHSGLRGKPKLIFVQACRGHQLDRGKPVYKDDAPSQQTHQLDSVDATHDVEEQPQELSLDREASDVETQAAVVDTSHSTDGNRPPTAQLLEALQQATEIELSAPMLPVEVDFLVHFSTPRGYYSWRRATGSVFAQTLCDVLDEYVNNGGRQRYLNELLAEVNNRVACSYVSVNDRQWLSGCKLMPVLMMKLRKSIILPPRCSNPISSWKWIVGAALSEEENRDDVRQIPKPIQGSFIIINNETFDNEAKREGTEHDVKKLVETFGGTFGFKVKEHKDKTADEIRGIIRKLGEEGDFSACECIGIAILTHGKEGSDHIVHGCDGGEVDLDTVFKPLQNCQSLAGKPKLILVQAGPLHVEDGNMDDVDMVNEANIVPVASEFSYYFALDVPAGRNEWKFKEKGSIFIQTFCNILLENSNGELDVETVKIRANNKILTLSGGMPVSQSTLMGKLFRRAV